MANQTTEITPVLTTNDNHVSPAKTALKVVLGAMTVSEEGSEGARIHEVKDICDVLDVLQKHGHNEIDTARVYGASEELLGQAKWQKKGIIMDTKLNPRRMSYSHNKEDLKRGLEDSLKALQTDQIDCWYLHTPDRNTSYTETLEAVNELYKAGHFKRFGVRNYAAWEVALIYRAVEPELFACLRGGGMLTGKYQQDTIVHEPGSRYDPKRFQGKSFRGWY
ncbi:Aldo/keto reductase [Metarhizium rileyi]|uniref:Aldo/keto reductase n=1 Tax=Metarhizium rileyi (strain RCEF 4871) TaxID=1649241 RepID=A0A166Z0A5_METRR|nr:Aldo/keto reductase [Metarhizium rileyi RCEF 4871]